MLDYNGDLAGMVKEGDLLRRDAGGTGRDRPRRLKLLLGSVKAATGTPYNRCGRHDAPNCDGERGHSGPDRLVTSCSDMALSVSQSSGTR